VYQENLFHTKMLLKDFDLDNYLFGDAASNLSAAQREQVEERVRHEMLEIFYGRNMPR
jgi:S-adenosylmethionine decarboxylase